MYTKECKVFMLISKYPQVNTNDWLWMMIFVKIISIWHKWDQRKKKIYWKLFASNEFLYTSILWLMLKASYESVELKRDVQSLIALFVESVEKHKEKTPNAESNTQCAFSISWKIVKLFSASRKKVQNAFSEKYKKRIPAKKRDFC